MLLISPLFFGFLAAAGALTAELFAFSFFPVAIGSIEFLFVSAFIEECAKYALLKKTLSQEKSVSRFMAFIVPFSIGFSALEISLLLLGNPVIEASTVFHAIGIFLLHLATILLIGYIIDRRLSKKSASLFVALAVVIHLLYNIVILYQDALHV